ncbi:MAG TPA: hypothetical protein VG944_11220 [Fimbriimonas sp.]|nr:hypothetical protein [Fimbriimonas sp.]
MNRPLLIGIAGGSGSGKTYFARQVRELSDPARVGLLSMDAYFRTEQGSKIEQINFDHPGRLDLDLLTCHLRALRQGEPIKAPSYDFRTMTQTPEATDLAPLPVVLVEGLFVLAPPLVDLFDLTCFLDVEADQRLLGRILRDMKEREASIDQTVDRYQRFVRPSHNVFIAPTRQNADVVVDFTYRRNFFTASMAELVLDYLQRGLDVEAIVQKARGDTYRLGYSVERPTMPMSVDIRRMAKAYPEQLVQHQPQKGKSGAHLFVEAGMTEPRSH